MLTDILQSTASALDSIGQASANVASVNGNKKARDLQYKMFQEANIYNSIEALRARQWSLEQWERENAYNDPSAVKQRLLDAGINPLLLDGEFSNSNPTPSSPNATSSGLPSITAPIVANPFANTSQDVLNIANAKKAISETEGFDLDNTQVQELLKMGLSPKEIGARLTLQQYLNERQKGKFIIPQALSDLKSNEVARQNTKAVTAYYKSQKKYVNEQVKNFGVKVDLDKRAQKLAEDRFNEEIRVNNARIEEMKSQTSLNNADKEETEKAISNMELQNKILSAKATLSRYGIFDESKSPLGTRMAVGLATGALSEEDAAKVLDYVGRVQSGIEYVGKKYGKTAEVAEILQTLEAKKLENTPIYQTIQTAKYWHYRNGDNRFGDDGMGQSGFSDDTNEYGVPINPIKLPHVNE